MKYFLTALVGASLIACTRGNNRSSLVTPEVPPVTQKKIDRVGTEAKLETLPNGLKVMAVSNSSYENAMVSVRVNVGTLDNPKEHAGLAHFVEHMVFLGNEKYKQDNLGFLQEKYGAMENAYTAPNETVYFAQATDNAFEDAISRIAARMDKPLFEETYVEKEKNAIHNEFVLRKDARAQMRMSQFVHPDHSAHSKFGVGNKDTLKNTRAKDAKEFFDKYYGAKNMTVVVASPRSVDEILNKIRAEFSGIKPGAKNEAIYEEISYDETRKNKLVIFDQEKEDGSLSLTLRFKEKIDISNPAISSLGSLMGDEGVGSLTAVLQSKGLIPPQEGALMGSSGKDQIQFRVSLTPQGEEKYQEVIQLMKAYVTQYFKKNPIPRYQVEQLQSEVMVGADKRTFGSISVGTTNHWAGNLFKYGFDLNDLFPSFESHDVDKLVVEAQKYQKEFEIASANAFLVRRRKNVANALLSQGTFVEENDYRQFLEIDGQGYYLDGLYQTVSKVNKFDISQVQAASDVSEFSFPPQNNYFPKNLVRYAEGVETPVLQETTEKNVQFYHQLGNFGETIVKLDVAISSAMRDEMTSKEVAALRMYGYLMADANNQKIYPMTIASSDVGVSFHYDTGTYLFTIHTYAETLDGILKESLSWLKNTDNQLAFEKRRRGLVSMVETNLKTNVNAISSDEYSKSLRKNYVTQYEIVNELASLDYDEMKSIVAKFLENVSVKAVMTGHFPESLPTQAITTMKSVLPQIESGEEVDVPLLYEAISSNDIDPVIVELEAEDSEQSLVQMNFFYDSGDSRKNEALGEALARWMSADFFDELRTKKQLAYSLGFYSSSYKNKGHHMAAQLISGTANSEVIKEAIDEFIASWIEKELPRKTQADLDGFFKQVDQDSSKRTVSEYHSIVLMENVLGEQVYEGYSDLGVTIDEFKVWAANTLVADPLSYFIIVSPKKEEPEEVLAHIH